MSPQAPASVLRGLPRLRVGQWLGLTIGVLLAFAITGIGLGLIASHRLSDQRHVVLDQVEPALLAALRLENALINQETGVRGYILSGNTRSLEPYEKGLADERRADRALDAVRAALASSGLASAMTAVQARVTTWQTRFVTPILRFTRAGHTGSVPASLSGKGLFDAIRAALAQMQDDLTARLKQARQQLASDAGFLEVMLLVAAGLVLSSVLGAGLLLRRIITNPLENLGRQAEHVAAGEFDHAIDASAGPREIVQLGGEIDAMRRRIVLELQSVEAGRAELQAQSLELERSNAELEQFAYVASHDLQEPLRKVASFCQALERRYHGQLDERADQYIEFAVDGAKRMQALINDLLAFSRVGRSGREREPVDLNEIAVRAQSALASAIEESGARVSVGQLPIVLGERPLLASLFQNLIGNAVKFHGEHPPLVRIEAHRESEQWHFSCADNGIGVDPEYAERIFVIFQRLHTRDAYPGTGIGLAMCRKIVEYHGGRMWLAGEHSPGARFDFTLPVAKEIGAQ